MSGELAELLAQGWTEDQVTAAADELRDRRKREAQARADATMLVRMRGVSGRLCTFAGDWNFLETTPAEMTALVDMLARMRGLDLDAANAATDDGAATHALDVQGMVNSYVPKQRWLEGPLARATALQKELDRRFGEVTGILDIDPGCEPYDHQN